jgi:hypothetical protein
MKMPQSKKPTATTAKRQAKSAGKARAKATSQGKTSSLDWQTAGVAQTWEEGIKVMVRDSKGRQTKVDWWRPDFVAQKALYQEPGTRFAKL